LTLSQGIENDASNIANLALINLLYPGNTSYGVQVSAFESPFRPKSLGIIFSAFYQM
jgi:hypothetical protein